MVAEYRAHLLGQGLSSATINLRLPRSGDSPRRWPTTGCSPLNAATTRVPGVARLGTRLGRWLTRDQWTAAARIQTRSGGTQF